MAVGTALPGVVGDERADAATPEVVAIIVVPQDMGGAGSPVRAVGQYAYHAIGPESPEGEVGGGAAAPCLLPDQAAVRGVHHPDIGVSVVHVEGVVVAAYQQSAERKRRDRQPALISFGVDVEDALPGSLA